MNNNYDDLSSFLLAGSPHIAGLVEGTWKPNIKTFYFPPSDESWMYYVLSGGTQRRAFVSLPEQRNENIKYFISLSGNRTCKRDYNTLYH